MTPLGDDAQGRPEHLDVLIVGAGLSGIGAAAHLQRRCPDRTFAILESRQASGGTWDLFRYPGVRSDSDMFTLGYAFKPWRGEKSITDGASILAYIRETAREHGLDRHIRYGCQVTAAHWSTEDARWTVEATRNGQPVTLTASFLFLCGGYYSYAAGYTPDFPGTDRYFGQIVHPQAWPPALDHAGKRVVIIGSGATAMTLAPAMAGTARHVTLLQRSPTYVAALPSRDAVADALRKWLPARPAYALIRARQVLTSILLFRLVRARPEAGKARLIGMVRKALGPAYDVETHFTPRYKPWDQRVCVVPDGDLFQAIKAGTLSMVTDQIETFTETGLQLASGQDLAADIVVTATGLVLQPLNGLALTVDGRRIEPGQALAYEGLMYDRVPNLASTFGYTNASWTLRADLTAEYVCRLLNHMRRKRLRQVMPVNDDPTMERGPWLDFTSGYVQRAMEGFPKQGARGPWKVRQNYLRDLMSLRFAKFEDGALKFSNPARR